MNNKKTLTRNEIMAALRRKNATLKRYSVRKIGLFGSYVAGRQKPNSDIDFLVEFEKPTYKNFMGLYDTLESTFKKKIELVTNGNLSKYIQPYVEKEVQWHEVK